MEPERLHHELEAILRADPVVWTALERASALDLPDWMIVSGAIYNTVWNALTGQPPGHGIKDVDLFYFDPRDLSWEAEDAVIRRARDHFSGVALPVEIRNQARVHLWYEKRFGRTCPTYRSSAHALSWFASKTHAVGVRLHQDDTLTVHAPFGLGDIFAMRIVANRALDNRETHEEKGERAKSVWPQVTVEPW
ncbi:nucleotidyltransferase family protein [Oricola sp.]|uniref:nucleotidyltransferase family protein n=1 Tax=Oricola sp. TaxID=1979950 RepID=UPI0025E97FA2|nr:nucleotidyltransferase family protein [Oricola sp.]MCI5077592.1 nucleotidyltransferase family protein [Oricola sp.]